MKLILDGLRKSFLKKEVLKGVDFSFDVGKIYGILGRNGAGKTTLFNCINNDLDYEGSIYLEVDGKKVLLTPDDIGYTLADSLVPEFLTGREFLKFFLDINKSKISDVKSVAEYFEMVGISSDDMDKLLKDYSLGMKNKMQLLVNIILDTRVLLFDEPLSSLDVVASEEMKKILKCLKKDHVLILSTHIMELAFDLCDEIVVLNHGCLRSVDGSKKSKEVILEALKES